MRKYLTAIFIVLFSGMVLAADYIPGEIIVKLRQAPIFSSGRLQASSVSSVFSRYNPKEIKSEFSGDIESFDAERASLKNFVILKFDPKINIISIIEDLKRQPEVEYAGPNWIVRAFADPIIQPVPNDPYYQSRTQWGLITIDAASAWDINSGEASTIIAVVDTGINYNHEDLSGKVTLGRNYVAGNNDPMDDHGHGTSLAGVIGAITNNNKGVAGVNWRCQLLAIKVLDSQGEGSNANAANGIIYAADHNAKVINLSFGVTTAVVPGDLQAAVDYANNKGAVVVAAAGNDGVSITTYPAAFSAVIGVAATNKSDQRAIWTSSNSSNYGTWVSVSAPGSAIVSTAYRTTTSYGTSSGTSLACPFVAGVASLIWEQNPSWINDQVRAQLLATCDNIDAKNPGYEGLLGSGRINAAKALNAPLADITSPTNNSVLTGTVAIKGTASGTSFISYTLAYGQGASPSQWTTIGTTYTASIENSTLGTWQTTQVENGNYTLRLQVRGNSTASDSVNVDINNPLTISGEAIAGPSPFSPLSGQSLKIKYCLSAATTVALYIFNLSGKTIYRKHYTQVGGTNIVTWDGKNMFGENCENGVYLFRLATITDKRVLARGKILVIN